MPGFDSPNGPASSGVSQACVGRRCEPSDLLEALCGTDTVQDRLDANSSMWTDEHASCILWLAARVEGWTKTSWLVSVGELGK